MCLKYNEPKHSVKTKPTFIIIQPYKDKTSWQVSKYPDDIESFKNKLDSEFLYDQVLKRKII